MSCLLEATTSLLLALWRVTKDQLAVLEKPSLPPLSALPHEIPEHALRVGQGESQLLD